MKIKKFIFIKILFYLQSLFYHSKNYVNTGYWGSGSNDLNSALAIH